MEMVNHQSLVNLIVLQNASRAAMKETLISEIAVTKKDNSRYFLNSLRFICRLFYYFYFIHGFFSSKVVLNVIGYGPDALTIYNVTLGDLILASQIFDDSRGIITNSCEGKLLANVVFGKAGVGKSTLASLIATLPGLFEVGTAMLSISDLESVLAKGRVFIENIESWLWYDNSWHVAFQFN